MKNLSMVTLKKIKDLITKAILLIGIVYTVYGEYEPLDI